METKKRGRKAGKGTLEAREYINENEEKLSQLLTQSGLSYVGVERIIRAIKFGLGIKQRESTQ